MTFLVPALLLALPLAALPVIIHLIHLYRRRQVKWAAMMFLRMAQRMNKGLSRLRQILILAFRVLAVMAILFDGDQAWPVLSTAATTPVLKTGTGVPFRNCGLVTKTERRT